MFHFVEAITNTKGDALPGYYVRILDSSGDVVSIYSDENSTPIINDSGVANMALVDDDGMVSFWAEVGTYDLDIYSRDATTFVRRVSDVQMLFGPQGPTGEQGPAGDVARADDRTALGAIVATAGLSRLLIESGREGVFIFDDSDLSTEVTNDPEQGVYVAPDSDTTGASGAWVRSSTDKTITPYLFGAQGGYDNAADAIAGTDDTTSVQAMFDFWANNPHYIPDLLAKFWTVTAETTIQQLADTVASGGIQRSALAMYGGFLVGKSGSSGPRGVTINAPNIHIRGSIGFVGCGQADGNVTNYGNRSWDYGLYIVDSHGIRIDEQYGANLRCWAVEMATEDFANLGTRTNTSGSNIGAKLGPTNGFNCGSAAGQSNTSCLTYTIATITYNGTTGSVSQTTTVEFVEALDTRIEAGDPFTYTTTDGDRTAYTIKTVDLVANTLEFYFWLPSTASAGETMDSAHGGFLHIHGNNSAEGQYGHIGGIRAGQGCRDSGLYGSYIGSIHIEASGIGHVYGKAPNSSSFGGSVDGMHCESTYLRLFNQSTTGSRRVIGPSSAWGNALDATGLVSVYHGRPRYSDDTLKLIGSHNTIVAGENAVWLENECGPSDRAAPGTSVTITNRPHERFFRCVYPVSAQNTLTFTFDWYDDYADLWTGKHWMGFEVYGVQAGRNALTQVTVQLSATMIADGYTLNGATAAIVYTTFHGPCIGRAVMDLKNKNLIFVMQELGGQELTGTTTVGDAAASLATATSKRVQIWNTPLTADRAVTLGTTNAKDGDAYEIVRTAAATGAFNLNVGSGPLKALAAGTWCKVVYDGTAAAWRLLSYGSL